MKSKKDLKKNRFENIKCCSECQYVDEDASGEHCFPCIEESTKEFDRNNHD